MKKIILYLLTIVIIIVTIIISKYYQLKDTKVSITKYNHGFEKYTESEIFGTDVTTVINQAVNNNEKFYIKKDDKSNYIQDDTNSIKIEVKINDLEEDTIYNMETLYYGGMNDFVRYYGQIKFKCTKKEYHENGKIKYILFEQIMS